MRSSEVPLASGTQAIVKRLRRILLARRISIAQNSRPALNSRRVRSTRATNHNGTKGAVPKEDFFRPPAALLKYSSRFCNTLRIDRALDAGYEVEAIANPLVILYSTNGIGVLPVKCSCTLSKPSGLFWKQLRIRNYRCRH